MAKKRDGIRENIFVTNEYFEKFGVSRQVIEYRRTSGKVKSIGIYKGMNLYFKFDADVHIIKYWINSFRRFIGEWAATQKIRQLAKLKIQEIDSLPKKIRFDNYNQDNYIEELEKLRSEEIDGASSKEYYELRKLIKQYWLNKMEVDYMEKKSFDLRLDIHIYIEHFLWRICSYKESNLSFDEYLKKEKIKVAEGKDPFNIFEYFLKQNQKDLSLDEIYRLRDDLLESL